MKKFVSVVIVLIAFVFGTTVVVPTMAEAKGGRTKWTYPKGKQKKIERGRKDNKGQNKKVTTTGG